MAVISISFAHLPLNSRFRLPICRYRGFAWGAAVGGLAASKRPPAGLLFIIPPVYGPKKPPIPAMRSKTEKVGLRGHVHQPVVEGGGSTRVCLLIRPMGLHRVRVDAQHRTPSSHPSSHPSSNPFSPRPLVSSSSSPPPSLFPPPPVLSSSEPTESNTRLTPSCHIKNM